MKFEPFREPSEMQWLNEENGLDLKGYFFKLLPFWYWFVISLVIGLSIAFVFNRYTTSMYPVAGTLMIQDKQVEGIAMLEELGATLENTRNIDNEIGILSSYTLLGEVVDSLGLTISYYGVGNIKTTLLYRSSPVVVRFSKQPERIENLKLSISNMQEDFFDLQIGSSEYKEQTRYDEWLEIKGMKFKIQKHTKHLRSDKDEGPVDIYFSDQLSCTKSFKNQISIKQQKKVPVLLNFPLLPLILI